MAKAAAEEKKDDKGGPKEVTMSEEDQQLKDRLIDSTDIASDTKSSKAIRQKAVDGICEEVRRRAGANTSPTQITNNLPLVASLLTAGQDFHWQHDRRTEAAQVPQTPLQRYR